MKEREAIRKMLQKNPVIAGKLVELIATGKIVSMESEADKDALLTVVCSSYDNAIEDCTTAPCACGKTIWLTPTTRETIAKRGQSPLRLICVQCWMKELKANAKAG